MSSSLHSEQSDCRSDCQGPLFTVAADAMELGLGVHGEAGVASMPLSNARFTTSQSSLSSPLKI